MAQNATHITHRATSGATSRRGLLDAIAGRLGNRVSRQGNREESPAVESRSDGAAFRAALAMLWSLFVLALGLRVLA
ncbi:MAG: hypothetical protein IIC82_04530 [Chloroflexi bacterium]|nr:hypothetical protein [Chloroflexota bacterium]